MPKGFDSSWRDFDPDAFGKGRPTSATPDGKRPHKYHAEPLVVDGIRFDSTKEAHHWQGLRLREQAGEIRGLTRQRPFALSVIRKGDGLEQVIGTIVMDFVYWEGNELVVEDVKSKVTREIALYKWKRKHFESQYGLTIREV